MKNIKNDGLTMDIEDKIKQLMDELGQNKCITPDGRLNNDFILTCLTQNNKRAAADHLKILSAFNKLKKNDQFFYKSNAKVSEETLNKIQLFGEHLVRPIIPNENYKHGAIHTGIIIKLPEKRNTNQYDDGESWKALIEKETTFKVGDKVLYCYGGSGSNLVLDNELLHLVCYFLGKIKE